MSRTATDYWCHLPFIPPSHTPIHSSQPLFPPVCPSAPQLAALAISKVWWVLVTTWPRCYTTHTSSFVTVCTCLCACVCLSEWACVRQTLPENECKNCFLSFFFFFLFDCAAEGLAGWAAHLLSAANNPNVSVTAGKSLFKWCAWRATRLIWLWAVEAHKYILNPLPFKKINTQSASRAFARTYKAAEAKCLLLSWLSPKDMQTVIT